MRIRPAATFLVLVGLLAGLALTTASTAAAAKPCWEKVIDDWLDNGNIDGTYKASCYQQALKHVPEDLRDYSDITDAISTALQNTLRANKNGGNGGGTSPSGSGNGDGTVNGSANGSAEPRRHLQAAPSRSYYRRAIDNLGTTSADSLPIPLLVLAGLGTALLASAAGLAAHKRLKRVRPPAS
jgi:hypothetical protein